MSLGTTYLALSRRGSSLFNPFQAPLLLAIRLFWGYYYVRSGIVKALHFSGVVDYFSGLGIHFPEFNLFIVVCLHFFGGLCIILGIQVRWISIPLAITMVVAYFTVEWSAVEQIFNRPGLFVQALPFNFLLANLLLIAFGAGKWSIDYLIERKLSTKQGGLR
jgi:putative oxidoreductase